MIEVLLGVVGVGLVSAILVLEIMNRSPEGYEDEDGFHVGKRPPEE